MEDNLASSLVVVYPHALRARADCFEISKQLAREVHAARQRLHCDWLSAHVCCDQLVSEVIYLMEPVLLYRCRVYFIVQIFRL